MKKKVLCAMIVSAILCSCGSPDMASGAAAETETAYISIDPFMSQENSTQTAKEEKYFRYLEQVMQTDIEQLEGIETADISLDFEGTNCTATVTLVVNASYPDDSTESIEKMVRTAISSYEIENFDILILTEEGTPKL